MRISYCSLGCKVNLYESEAIVNKFLDNGFELVEFPNETDVCIINTCTVTQTSDSKSRKIIRKAISHSPNAVICVMGCYSQLNNKDVCDIPGVSIVTGTSERDKIYDLAVKKLKEKNFECVDLTQSYYDINCYENLSLNRFNDRTRGFIKVQDGCENFCSYCTIPYSRGKLRSRDKDAIITEIATLTKEGMREVVLTGINTGAYGKESNICSFPKLIDEICNKVENLGRIRISSIEATEINDELLEVLKKNSKHICMHLHVPLQGGCDKTLKNMNRKYDTKYFKEKISKIRSYFPDINITTDFLAGFSGETEEDFQDAFNFVSEMEFGEMHVFPYSPRIRTEAYKYPNRVSDAIKKFRVNMLLSLNKVNALKYREKFRNKVVDCLVEKNENGICFGHSSNYLDIIVEKDDDILMKNVAIKLIEVKNDKIFGKVIKK